MFEALLVVAALGVPPAPADTVIELRRGDRIVIENLTGDVTVSAWDRSAMEILEEDRGMAVDVQRSGATVRLAPGDARRRRRSIDASIRLPAWVDLEVSSPSLDISVRGMLGEINIGNVNGDVVIEDAGGPVDVRSIEGEIFVTNARSGVRASSQSDDVTLRRVTGSVEVHSGDGDIILDDVDSESVRAETQDGDISFNGTISDGGSYGFFVHDGDAAIAVPAAANARVRVSTFDGEFESDFPIRLERFTGGREFEFTLGDGAAALQIEVFDGEIRLLRRR